jgi:hypothetical protein
MRGGGLRIRGWATSRRSWASPLDYSKPGAKAYCLARRRATDPESRSGLRKTRAKKIQFGKLLRAGCATPTGSAGHTRATGTARAAVF